MQVRTLEERDIEAALDLFAAVAGEGLWLSTEAPFDRREMRARWRDLLATREGTILVADDGGAPVGLAALVGTSEPELGMLVRADRRREGIGDALVVAAIDWALRRGASRIVLHVFPHNSAAIALYEKHGFGARGSVKRGYRRRSGEAWDAIRMVKELRAGPQEGDAPK